MKMTFTKKCRSMIPPPPDIEFLLGFDPAQDHAPESLRRFFQRAAATLADARCVEHRLWTNGVTAALCREAFAQDAQLAPALRALAAGGASSHRLGDALNACAALLSSCSGSRSSDGARDDAIADAGACTIAESLAAIDRLRAAIVTAAETTHEWCQLKAAETRLRLFKAANGPELGALFSRAPPSMPSSSSSSAALAAATTTTTTAEASTPAQRPREPSLRGDGDSPVDIDPHRKVLLARLAFVRDAWPRIKAEVAALHAAEQQTAARSLERDVDAVVAAARERAGLARVDRRRVALLASRGKAGKQRGDLAEAVAWRQCVPLLLALPRSSSSNSRWDAMSADERMAWFLHCERVVCAATSSAGTGAAAVNKKKGSTVTSAAHAASTTSSTSAAAAAEFQALRARCRADGLPLLLLVRNVGFKSPGTDARDDIAGELDAVLFDLMWWCPCTPPPTDTSGAAALGAVNGDGGHAAADSGASERVAVVAVVEVKLSPADLVKARMQRERFVYALATAASTLSFGAGVCANGASLASAVASLSGRCETDSNNMSAVWKLTPDAFRPLFLALPCQRWIYCTARDNAYMALPFYSGLSHRFLWAMEALAARTPAVRTAAAASAAGRAGDNDDDATERWSATLRDIFGATRGWAPSDADCAALVACLRGAWNSLVAAEGTRPADYVSEDCDSSDAARHWLQPPSVVRAEDDALRAMGLPGCIAWMDLAPAFTAVADSR